jgi:hypothetical protein
MYVASRRRVNGWNFIYSIIPECSEVVEGHRERPVLAEAV